MTAPSFAGFQASQPRVIPSPTALRALRGRDADGRVRALVGLRHGLRPAFGALALCLVERRAHEKLGFRSLGDYARERLGCTAHAVREAARVWKALLTLPRLRAAVLEGAVSWSAARRAVALVPPDLDALAVESLRGRTVRAVAVMAAAVRAAEGAATMAVEAPGRVAIRLAVPRETAERWHAALELARRMAGEPIPAWEAAEAIAAETLAALPVAAAAEAFGTRGVLPAAPPSPHAAAGDRREHGLRSRAFPLLRWVRFATVEDRSLDLDGLLAWARAASPHALDAALLRANARLQEIDHDLGHLLRQILERRLHLELGFPSFERYAEERADLSPRTARRRIRLARLGRPGSPAANAFREGRLSEAQAEAVGVASDPATEAWWVAFARAHTLRRLEDVAAERSATRTSVSFHAPPDAANVILAALEAARHALARARGGRPSPADALRWMLDHAIATWEEQGRAFTDYADFARDGFRCTAPGCTARRNLQAHHIVFRSHGGADAPWNRTTLCAFHHLRGIHARTVSCTGRAPEGLEFALGLRTGGPPLLRTRSGDVLVRA